MNRILRTPGRRSEARRMIRLAAALAWCALVIGSALASAEIYRWTDERGVERFSDRIEDVPEAHRGDVTRALRAEERIAPAAPVATPGAQEPPIRPLPSPPGAAEVELPAWSEHIVGLGLAVAVLAALVGIGLWLLLAAFALRLACRVVGEEVPAFGRAVAVSAVQLVVGIAAGGVLVGAVLAGLVDAASPAFQGLQLLATFLVNATVVRAMLALSLGRALVVALLALVIAVVIGVLAGIAIGLVLGVLLGGSGG